MAGLDPYVATREEFTKKLLSFETPSNANTEWKVYSERSKELLSALASHPAMAANLQQAFMTPAASKNKIYFMWDFVSRTMGMYLYAIPPENPHARPSAAAWSDVVSRTSMAKMLLTPTFESQLHTMVEGTYASQRDNHPETGEAVLAAAKALP